VTSYQTAAGDPPPAPPGTAPAPPGRPGPPGYPLTPGRRWALALGAPVALIGIVATGFNLVGSVGKASFPVGRSLPLASGHFALNEGGGDVDLRGVPRVAGAAPGTARVTGTVTYSLVRPKVYWYDGTGGAEPGVRLACSFWSMAGCDLNAHVDLPIATVVNASTDGGNVSAADLSGAVTLHTGGGDVSVSDLSGDVSVTTNGGNVSLDRISGVPRRPVTVHTGGGDITGTAITAPDLRADTNGGNVGLTLTAVPGNLHVHTGGGDVTIVLPPGFEYDVSTSTGGGDVNVSDAVRRHENASSPHKVIASTGGGNINIIESA
jgi:Putative adhesin